MTSNELWEIKVQVYKNLEASLEASNQSEDEKMKVYNHCIGVVEDFWLNSLINLMDKK